MTKGNAGSGKGWALLDWLLALVMAIAAVRAFERGATSMVWVCVSVAVLAVQMANRIAEVNALRNELEERRRPQDNRYTEAHQPGFPL